MSGAALFFHRHGSHFIPRGREKKRALRSQGTAAYCPFAQQVVKTSLQASQSTPELSEIAGESPGALFNHAYFQGSAGTRQQASFPATWLWCSDPPLSLKDRRPRSAVKRDRFPSDQSLQCQAPALRATAVTLSGLSQREEATLSFQSDAWASATSSSASSADGNDSMVLVDDFCDGHSSSIFKKTEVPETLTPIREQSSIFCTEVLAQGSAELFGSTVVLSESLFPTPSCPTSSAAELSSSATAGPSESLLTTPSRPSSGIRKAPLARSTSSTGYGQRSLTRPTTPNRQGKTDSCEISPALAMSFMMQDQLFDLRRVGKGADSLPSSPVRQETKPHSGCTACAELGSPPQSRSPSRPLSRRKSRSPSPESLQLHPADDDLSAETPAQDESVFHFTLKNLSDTEWALRELELPLLVGTQGAADVGGGRHATTVVSTRLLALVGRKADLLHAVETRLASFESAFCQRLDVLQQLLEDTGTVPPELKGIRQFIREYTHYPGEPWEADKSDFDFFIKHVKLSSQHIAMRRLKAKADEAGEWWADMCLEKAMQGETHPALKRLFRAAKATGVPKNHPKMLRAEQVLIDRLADWLLSQAQDALEHDSQISKQGRQIPGPAGAAANRVEQLMWNAKKEGVSEKDHRYQQATLIIKDLRQRDFDRRRWAKLRAQHK